MANNILPTPENLTVEERFVRYMPGVEYADATLTQKVTALLHEVSGDTVYSYNLARREQVLEDMMHLFRSEAAKHSHRTHEH